MTLEEKTAFCSGKTFWATASCERPGLRAVKIEEVEGEAFYLGTTVLNAATPPRMIIAYGMEKLPHVRDRPIVIDGLDAPQGARARVRAHACTRAAVDSTRR